MPFSSTLSAIRYYELITQLADDESLFDSMKDALDRIKEDEENGKDPDRDIHC